MSDEQKRIEELENQLKIVKLEKELAEEKAKNNISERKSVSKKEQEATGEIENIKHGTVGKIISVVVMFAALVIIAFILSEIFPNAFSDTIEYANPVTGQKISVPVESDDPALNYGKLEVFPYNGFLIKFDAEKTTRNKALSVAKDCTREAKVQGEVDQCVYENLYEQSAYEYR